MSPKPSNRRSTAGGEAAPKSSRKPSSKGKEAAPVALAPSASSSQPGYGALPKLVTTWPRAFRPTGKAGFSSPAKWQETNGADLGITSMGMLRGECAVCSIVPIPMERIGEVLGGLSLSGRANDAVLPNDPGVLRADPGPLRAVVWVPDGRGGAQTVTTSVTTSLYTADREGIYRQVLDQALLVAPEGDPLVRVAWITDKRKVRLVEYVRSSSAQVQAPASGEDLEAVVPAMALYTAQDAVDDALRALTRLKDAPTLVVAAPAVAAPVAIPADSAHSGGISGGSLPSAPVPVSQGAGNASVAAAPPVPGKPFGGGRPFGANADLELFAASQRVLDGGPKDPTPDSCHVVLVVNSLNDLNSKVVDGKALVHVGVASNYRTMMVAGSSKDALLDASSKVFIAVRSGDTCTIALMIPYAGLLPNNGAARLILDPNLKQDLKPCAFSMAQLGMQRPNLPFIIGRTTSLSGFNIPTSARQAIWNTIYQTQGWAGNGDGA